MEYGGRAIESGIAEYQWSDGENRQKRDFN